MKRQMFALTTGAALIASLLVGSSGIAQANTDTTPSQPAAAVCTGGEHVLLRAEAAAPANAAVTCNGPEGASQEGMPANELAQPATPGSGQAEIASATQAAGVSKAAAPKEINGQVELAAEQGHLNQAPKAKDINGQVELATEPSNMSQAPKAQDANGQIELATEPGHASTEVDSK